ncbi:MAG: DUF4245 domain-containing protein [Actinomycetes bacterium]
MTETPAVQDPVAPPGRKRGRETIRDMVLSLSVVLGVVFVVLLVGMRGGPPTQTVHEVGYTAQLVQAREAASYDVLAPVGLPPGWKATSVRGLTTDGTVTWHLGFVTPHGRYAALEQSAGAAQPFVDDFADGAKAAGRSPIGGHVWQRIEGGRPERRALVLHGTGVTTVVAGGASWGELETLARSLRGKAG